MPKLKPCDQSLSCNVEMDGCKQITTYVLSMSRGSLPKKISTCHLQCLFVFSPNHVITTFFYKHYLIFFNLDYKRQILVWKLCVWPDYYLILTWMSFLSKNYNSDSDIPLFAVFIDWPISHIVVSFWIARFSSTAHVQINNMVKYRKQIYTMIKYRKQSLIFPLLLKLYKIKIRG